MNPEAPRKPPLNSELRLVDEAARRQGRYETALAQRLDEEHDMHPNDRLDDLGHEIFRLAIFKGETAENAVRLAMKDPLAKRRRIRDDLTDRLAHEFDWLANDHEVFDRRANPIRTVDDLATSEDFLITRRCCEQYCRLTPRARLRSSSNSLRAEIRANGRFVHRGGDYLRVWVPRRFVLRIKRTPDGFLEAVSATRLPRRRPRRHGKRTH